MLKAVLFDMDGTLYLGDQLFPFTIELLKRIKETGGMYMFMTNNSSKSVVDYVKKLEKLGIPATRDEFMTSSQATAFYLKQNHPGKKLYVCGTKSLIRELESEGFTYGYETLFGDAARPRRFVFEIRFVQNFTVLWAEFRPGSP